MPTVSEFIRFCRNFSMITFTPLRVVCPGLPVVIGVVLMSLPLMKVFIWWVCALTLLTTASPTWKEIVRDSWP